MRRIIFTLPLMLATYLVCPAQTPITLKTIPLPEVSGVLNIDEDRVMLVADEGYDVQIVSKAGETFKTGDPKSFESNMKPAFPGVTVNTKEAKKIMNDIEDVAWDKKEQAAFVITSHSLNTDQEEKPARYKLARLLLKPKTTEVTHLEIDVLKEALKKQFPFVADAMKARHELGGSNGTFNIEGLAFDTRTRALLIGLRSPTQVSNAKPCAVVFTLKNPHELFKDKPAPPEFDPKLNCLDLGGLGIRGMTYDDERKGVWIVAGRSDDPAASTNPTPVLSSLWFWDTATQGASPRKAQVDLLGLVSIEGVSLLKLDGKQGLLLVSDDGDETQNKVSRYLWIPVPKLTGAQK